MQSPSPSSPGHVSPPVATARPNRLLYRRGLPDLPELIETEEEDITPSDNVSMATFSTRHSASTSTSSREFPTFSSSSTTVQQLKTPVPSHARFPPQHPHDFYNTPPGSVNQLQTPFEYVPNPFQFKLAPHEEASPPPSPHTEAPPSAERAYGLGVSLPSSNPFESGMDENGYEMSSEIEETNTCRLEGCPECAGLRPVYQPSPVGQLNSEEAGEYISPPSSPGTDCTCTKSKGIRADFLDNDDRDDDFYGLSAESYHSLDRPRSPSLLLDNDAFSSVPAFPTFPHNPLSSDDSSPDAGRPSKGILSRKSAAVLNKVFPRSFRLKRWSSTPSLPKLQISSPPPLPRMASSNILPMSPTQASRTTNPPVPLNTAFDYDPYSDRQSDDEDDYETRRPTTRGTMMSREQLPTPPFLPSVAPTLPYIPPLDSPVSQLSYPQSPAASTVQTQPPFFPLQPTPRNNSLTSLSNVSLTSLTPVSPTVLSPGIQSPVMTAAGTVNIGSIRSLSTPQQSPQIMQNQFSPVIQAADVVEELVQQMELEDNAFAATEKRMATSGWSTETELHELRAKRATVRREWEERIQSARKKRRGSDQSSIINTPGSSTPIITLPNSSVTSLNS